MLHSAENDSPHKQCGMCSSLSDQEYAFQKYGWDKDNTYLPATANHLKDVRYFHPYDSRKLQVRQCYEYGVHIGIKALRKRVLLPAPVPQVQVKSPVRKIRTPGSVRGLLGNWQSYRNGNQSAFY